MGCAWGRPYQRVVSRQSTSLGIVLAGDPAGLADREEQGRVPQCSVTTVRAGASGTPRCARSGHRRVVLVGGQVAPVCCRVVIEQALKSSLVKMELLHWGSWVRLPSVSDDAISAAIVLREIMPACRIRCDDHVRVTASVDKRLIFPPNGVLARNCPADYVGL